MAEQLVIDILNKLLAEEQLCSVPRLVASTAFVPREAAKDWDRLRDLSRAGELHDSMLTDLILSLDGIPRPRVTNVRAAEQYFQDLRYLLPRLIEDYQRLVRNHRASAAMLHREPRASALISRISDRYEQILSR